MNDQWYFEIGDGKTYGPFPLEKLRKWAEAGNLMPTHRVRRADESEWTIAAYVPGLELTTAVPPETNDAQDDSAGLGRSLGALVGGKLRRKKPQVDQAEGKLAKSSTRQRVLSTEPPDIVGICHEILEMAFERGASDIHLEPEEHILLIQFRIDGQLETLRKLPKALHAPVLGRLKVLAKMDIAERRMPQDGQFAYALGPDKRRMNIRAACLPTTQGERLTLRLLALETGQLTLDRLGMSPVAMQTFARIAGQDQGLILLTGPTGSGKSTTLYAALRHRLAHRPGKIITVEDPVEFDIVGVAQAEVDTADKLRFDTALRNILRSDPDVIMIGEIRDYDSADIAVKAALTGHLVFSSLHTNSAAGVITRLVDVGIQPYLIAATLRLCIAQRLVRRLCPHCRRPRDLTAAEAELLGQPDKSGTTVYDAGACDRCNERGYRGRIGLFELLPVDHELARRIVDGSDEGQISTYARSCKIAALRDDAAEKVLAGTTSFQELVTVSALW
jgi:type II secretory ATPase GspE/PulE/Tfp pilus assembly ATPase PilB-like protein